MEQDHINPIDRSEVSEELERVLESIQFRRAQTMSKFLRFICQEALGGRTDSLKEYGIGVMALGRPASFDPQSDPIVRVTAHGLRKRLDAYYAVEGRNDPVYIQIPVGSYAPRFVRAHEAVTSGEIEEECVPDAVLMVTATAEAERVAPHLPGGRKTKLMAAIVAFAVVLAVLIGFFWFYKHRSENAVLLLPPMVARDAILRVRMGMSEVTVDSSGYRWQPDTFCQGGSSYSHSSREVESTATPEVFQGGREGRFDCAVKLAPGKYELHLLLAETTGAGVATHRSNLLFAGRKVVVDPVSDMLGAYRADKVVMTDIAPDTTGFLHIQGDADDAYLSAFEIYSASADGKQRPFFVFTGPRPFTDAEGRIWQPDQGYIGGSRIQRFMVAQGTETTLLYQWERFGHFTYMLPAVIGQKYRLTLYFSEGYFGPSRFVPGGVGSRVFDVSINGRPALQSFDISREAKPGHDTVTCTFNDIEPESNGQVEVEFIPRQDYALLNALALTPQ